MLSKLFLVVVTAAILAAAGLVPREDTTDFSKRCPKGIRGDRRISSDNKVFARCRKEGNGGTQFQDNDFVWSVLNLGQCFANDNGVVVPRLSYVPPTDAPHPVVHYRRALADI